ncbi:MAG: hypothetical protein ACKVUS_05590 [Saprospiraceae bacterium]
MHDNVLSEEQKALLPFVQSFRKEFYLVGGTAIALQIGHLPQFAAFKDVFQMLGNGGALNPKQDHFFFISA